ncbi:hypothetical protein Sps_04468 [Shewanella psychrophila]|uniref:Uncharacterized protein n=1 Tax=Shewanella psychrophila TaxID=225848 RepID=A0A1S6HVU8_9GAMM|nr:twin-arginine translocation signal domain-containing protein [Shewanella psychrophila]AQS39554.1 hypothetical protein Sps_04468 [Shewanella psychrophila]
MLNANKLKAGSTKPEVVSAYTSGLNRRAFLRQTGAAAIVLGLIGTKPSVLAATDDIYSDANSDDSSENTEERGDNQGFNSHEQAVIEAVLLQLFPNDGDGPSAIDLNAFRYLSWALEDPENKADGIKRLF